MKKSYYVGRLVHHQATYRPDDLVINPVKFPGLRVGDIVELHLLNEKGEDERDFLWNREAALFSKIKSLEATAGNVEVSVLTSVAELFQLPNRCKVIFRVVPEYVAHLDAIEMSIKNQYIGRSDMWRIKTVLSGDCLYTTQNHELEGMRMRVDEMAAHSAPVRSGCVTPDTKFTFRSTSGRLLMLIQLSSEMWNFADDGELYYEKAIGFLRVLFSEWEKAQVSHLLSIIIFSRTLFDPKEGGEIEWSDRSQHPNKLKNQSVFQIDESGYYYQDHYKVIVDAELQGPSIWESQLRLVKSEFAAYPALMKWGQTDPHTGFKGVSAPAASGNLLEAINSALSVYVAHYIDRDFYRTGQNIQVVSAGSGFHWVNEKMARLTKHRMVDSGIGCDMVCVVRPPLHHVPLFRYKAKEDNEDKYHTPEWMNIIFYDHQDLYRTPFGTLREDGVTRSKLEFTPLAMGRVFDGFMKEEAHKHGVVLAIEGGEPPPHGANFLGFPTLDVSPLYYFEQYDASVFSMKRAIGEVREDFGNSYPRLPLYDPPSEDPPSKSQDDSSDGGRGRELMVSPVRTKLYGPGSTTASQLSLSAEKQRQQQQTSLTRRAAVARVRVGDWVGTPVLVEEVTHKEAGTVLEAKEAVALEARLNNLNTPHHGPNLQTPHHHHSLLTNTKPPQRQNKAVGALALRKTNPFTLDHTPHLLVRDPRWNHIYSSFKGITLPSLYDTAADSFDWKMHCKPAILPLTTDWLPSAAELHQFYISYPNTLNMDNDHPSGQVTEALLHELVCQRQAQDYQIVLSKLKHQNEYHLVIHNQYHKLTYNRAMSNIKIERWSKKTTLTRTAIKFPYRYHLWSPLTGSFMGVDRDIESEPNTYDWQRCDNLVCGIEDEFQENLKDRRVRYAIIPPARGAHREDEDIARDAAARIAGLEKLLKVVAKKTMQELNITLQTSALFQAAACGDAKTVSGLLATNAAVNALNSDGCSALTLAVREGHSAVVDTLIRAKADLDLQDKDGMTAVMWAVVRNRDDLLKTLLEQGADSSLYDKHERNAWYWASQIGRTTTLTILQHRTLLTGAAGGDQDKDDSIRLDLSALREISDEQIVQWLQGKPNLVELKLTYPAILQQGDIYPSFPSEMVHGIIRKTNYRVNLLGLHVPKFLEETFKSWIAEHMKWKKIPAHPHVARFIGVAHQEVRSLNSKFELTWISERCPVTSLVTWLEAEPVEPTERMVLQLALGIAYGLRHLHRHDIVYELIAETVFIGDGPQAVLQDFGVSNINLRKFTLKGQGLALPETKYRLGKAADPRPTDNIFSFGVVLWVLTHRAKLHHPSEVLQFTSPFLRIRKLALRCCDTKESVRPSAEELVELIEKELLEEDKDDLPLLLIRVGLERYVTILGGENGKYTGKDLRELTEPDLMKAAEGVGIPVSGAHDLYRALHNLPSQNGTDQITEHPNPTSTTTADGDPSSTSTSTATSASTSTTTSTTTTSTTITLDLSSPPDSTASVVNNSKFRRDSIKSPRPGMKGGRSPALTALAGGLGKPHEMEPLDLKRQNLDKEKEREKAKRDDKAREKDVAVKPTQGWNCRGTEPHSVKVKIDTRHTGRPQWVLFQYDNVFDPEVCFHFEIRWLVASGLHVEEWVKQSITKTLKNCGLQALRIPPDQKQRTSDFFHDGVFLPVPSSRVSKHAEAFLVEQLGFVPSYYATCIDKHFIHQTGECIVRSVSRGFSWNINASLFLSTPSSQAVEQRKPIRLPLEVIPDVFTVRDQLDEPVDAFCARLLKDAIAYARAKLQNIPIKSSEKMFNLVVKLMALEKGYTLETQPRGPEQRKPINLPLDMIPETFTVRDQLGEPVDAFCARNLSDAVAYGDAKVRNVPTKSGANMINFVGKLTALEKGSTLDSQTRKPINLPLEVIPDVFTVRDQLDEPVDAFCARTLQDAIAYARAKLQNIPTKLNEKMFNVVVKLMALEKGYLVDPQPRALTEQRKLPIRLPIELIGDVFNVRDLLDESVEVFCARSLKDALAHARAKQVPDKHPNHARMSAFIIALSKGDHQEEEVTCARLYKRFEERSDALIAADEIITKLVNGISYTPHAALEDLFASLNDK